MFDRIDISKEIWKEISDVLKKHKIPYTTRMEYSDTTSLNKHIQINLVIPDYSEDK